MIILNCLFVHAQTNNSSIHNKRKPFDSLMVQTNPPRFMREGDKMEFSARIANLSAEEMTGQVSLEL
ncbi:MAG: alpha-2-macroglobulin family protein, partial [Sediminibacterium sp.]